MRVAAASSALSPLSSAERIFDRSQHFELHPEPVFIIGHWQAGHSVLHNLLAGDPQFATLKLEHVIAPGSRVLRPVLKRSLRGRLPQTRGVDQMPSGLSSLQGDDFLLAGLTDLSFYYAYVFPTRAEDVFNRALLFDGVSETEAAAWRTTYRTAITRVAAEQGRSRFLSRNASNTTRIPQLLQMFPKAKFIHIARHPAATIAAQEQRWRALTDNWSLEPKPTTFFELSLRLFERMTRKYVIDRDRIPPQQLCEVRCEDLDLNPAAELHRIYEHLQLGNFTPMRNSIANIASTYVGKLSGSPDELSAQQMQAVRARCGSALANFGYEQSIRIGA